LYQKFRVFLYGMAHDQTGILGWVFRLVNHFMLKLSAGALIEYFFYIPPP
jgi:hypothetical protein